MNRGVNILKYYDGTMSKLGAAALMAVVCLCAFDARSSEIFLPRDHSTFLFSENLDQSYLGRIDDVVLSESDPKRTQTFWNSELSGTSFRDEVTQSESVRFSAGLKASHQLAPQIITQVEGKLDMTSANVQSVFDDYRPRNGLVLNQGVVIWVPVKWFDFKAGAINQGYLNSPLLLSERAFPATLQQFYFNNDSNTRGLRLVFQQAIPTSETLGTRTTEKEPTPYLFTQTVAAHQSLWDQFHILGSMTYFDFSRLPSEIARESRLYGNSVKPSGPFTAEFDYGFSGIASQIQVRHRFHRSWQWRVGYSYLENSAAPADINKGQIVSLWLNNYNLNDVVLIGRVDYFINQSDSSPAAYNSGFYGHNNREGMAYELRSDFQNYGFFIRARYVHNRAIDEVPFQHPQNYFLVSFGTNYVEI